MSIKIYLEISNRVENDYIVMLLILLILYVYKKLYCLKDCVVFKYKWLFFKRCWCVIVIWYVCIKEFVF